MPGPTQIYFPRVFMQLLKPAKNLGPNKFCFKMKPNITKPEIKQYLEKIYDVKVTKVNTLVYEKTFHRTRFGVAYSTPKYKKAYVTIDPTKNSKNEPITPPAKPVTV
jgi:large subunit ribosomal protein L23